MGDGFALSPYIFISGGNIMNIKTNLANRKNYGGARSASSIKYIVVHYTGNDGDTDENNGKYFKNNIVQASAHYFVDDDSITQSVPDNFVAWHCGAKKYKHAYCRNSNSIGVELCDDVRNGVIYPSEKTIANALELVEHLMQKYSIPKTNVIRHYDVSGKLCPVYWCGAKDKDTKWKTAFWSRLGADSGTKKTVQQIAREVISGKWGNGAERKKRLTAAGYSYNEVQSLVNQILSK